MRSTISCCYQCDHRTLGCHGTCEQYKKEVAQWDAVKADIRKQKELSYQLDEVREQKFRKIKKRKAKK